VIDTGVDLKHPDLKVTSGKSFVTRVTSYTDDNGHGTHVAGIAAALDNSIGVVGVAPEVSLYSVKVLDRNGSGYYSWIISGIGWCGQYGMNVANMSLGGSVSSSALEAACDSAYASGAGVLLVAAAGNGGDGSVTTNEISYPAYYASVISVGATDSSDALASYSNTNADVEISAPGTYIKSTYKGSAYAILSGTSMASPHVAGVAALIWGEMLTSPGTTPAKTVREELITRVRDVNGDGRDNGYGYGIVDYSK
jgi:subtilisin family serine protease